MGFTGIYWDLLGFTMFDCFLLGFTVFYWDILGFAKKSHQIRMGFRHAPQLAPRWLAIGR